MFVVAAVVLLAMPGDALANIGIPMIVVTWPGMGIVLIPVVVLEAYILRSRLCQLTLKICINVAAVSNLLTTLVGIPLTWGVLFGIEYFFALPEKRVLETPFDALVAVTIQAPWMYNYRGNHHWMIPAAAIWLMIPFFFMSWWLEYIVAARMLKDIDRHQVKSSMLRANLVSYVLLEVLAVAWLVQELNTGVRFH